MSDEVPLVSVGIPTYNRPEGLRRTLECITGQTYQNLEIIVSDNCSPGPETERVVREFMEKDSRIQYFKQEENKGPTFNFRFVLEKATGEYFMWAADDDWWDNCFIAKLIPLLTSSPSIGMAFSNMTAVDESGIVNRKDFNFKPFSGKKSILRSMRYVLAFEFSGKANLFYSIYRTDLCQKKFLELVPYLHLKGADMCFVTCFISHYGLKIYPISYFCKNMGILNKELNEPYVMKVDLKRLIYHFIIPNEYFICMLKTAKFSNYFITISACIIIKKIASSFLSGFRLLNLF